MKLNSKQKLYVSVLGLCAVALLLDKTFLGPSSASAEPMSTAPAAAMAPPIAGDPSAAVTAGFDRSDSARAVIAERLAAVSDRAAVEGDAIGDAFRPAASWLPSPDVAARPVVDAGSAGDRFRRSHQLNAVMAGGTGYALVDGRTLLVGQMLDGFTLISVSETGALFENEKGQVELTLPIADR